MLEIYNGFLWGMTALAVVVFFALYHVRAGYGLLRDGHWGPQIGNRWGWFLMESPVFFAMLVFWLCSPRRFDAVPLIFLCLFQLHYFNRSFIYPMLLKGRSKMPLGIIVMGVVFNLLNAAMQGLWIFYLVPEGRYSIDWLTTPQFIIGVVVFFAGMVINMHSDHIIRHLRKPVPLRLIGQLLRRDSRMDRFCHLDLVGCRSCVCHLDLCESGASG